MNEKEFGPIRFAFRKQGIILPSPREIEKDYVEHKIEEQRLERAKVEESEKATRTEQAWTTVKQAVDSISR
jgi:hypothetical protein